MSENDPDSVLKARYEEFQNLYRSGRLDEAIEILEELAEKNVAVAQLVFGNMFLFGSEPDPVKTKFWLEKAANNETPEAFYGLGIIFLNGIGVEESAHEAFEYFLKGTNLGDIQSSAILGEMLAGAQSVSRDMIWR